MLPPIVRATGTTGILHANDTFKPIPEMITGTFTPEIDCYARVTGHLVLNSTEVINTSPQIGAGVYLSTSGATAVYQVNTNSKVVRPAGATGKYVTAPINAMLPLAAGIPYKIQAAHYCSTAETVAVAESSCLFVQLLPR